MAIFYTDSGSFNLVQVTGSANISASSGIALQVRSSGSTVFSVSGSSGEIFNISDVSSTNLFSVSSGSVGIFSIDNTKAVRISGSLIVTGSITGSLFGTASYATQALSASFASTASFVTSASFASTASFVTNAQTASAVTVTDTTTGTGPYYVAFTDGTTGARNIRVDSVALTFNATTNVLSTTASFATSASFAISSSRTVSASFATSASFAISSSRAVSASFAISSSRTVSSSFAISSSRATTSSFALNAPQFTYYAAKLTQTYSGGTITSGLLVVGESYEITTYQSGDDFSNVAEVTYGVINTNGCVFKAIGTKPTTYSNSSTLTPLGYPVAEVTPSMNTLADRTIPYWRRLAAGIYHFNFSSSVDHIKVAPKFQPDSLNNYKTRAIVNQSNNASYSFLDTRFVSASNAVSGFNSTIFAVDYQSDGKIIVGGNFTDFNGVTINYICRLNKDGTEDTTFTSNIGSGFNNIVNAIIVRSDDTIIVGGDFTSFNGTTVNYICGLNADGTIDGTFATNIGNGFNAPVYSVKVFSDSSILAGGAFTDFNSNTVGYIAKLANDGLYDSSFTAGVGTGFNASVYALDIDNSTEDIYVGGAFTSFDGTTVNYAAKIRNGTQDTTFSSNISTNLNGTVYAIRYNTDKVLIGGNFTAAFGSALNYVCQVNSNGTEDIDFTSVATDYGAGNGYNGIVYAIEAVADGWLVGGNFTAFNSSSPNYFNYLQNTGKQLNGYRAFGLSFDSTVRSLKLYPGNKILVGGNFTNYDSVTSKYFSNLYYTYDVILITDGDSGIGDGYLNKSSIEVTLYN